MRIVFYLLVTGIAAIVTFALSWLILKLSHRYRLYPKIRERDVHTRPTPRLGGIAMFLGIVAAIGVASQVPTLGLVFSEQNQPKILAIVAASLIIVLIGVADDIWDLDWLTKLAGQIIAAGVLVWGGVQILQLPIGGITLLSPFQSLVITMFAIVLVMNAVNFIDGLDGLVAGVAIIANGVFFIYAYVLQLGGNTAYFNLAALITAVLIGACLGFLPWNFHPARLFMGDAGALLVGLLMGVSAVTVTGEIDLEGIVQNQVGGANVFEGQIDRGSVLPAFIPILLPIAILIVPLLDFGLAVIRRLRAGKSPFSADRLHLHHRLLDMGHSHLHAVLIFYTWTTAIAVGTLMFLFFPWYQALVFIVAGIIISTIVTVLPLGRRPRLVDARPHDPGPAGDPGSPQEEGTP